MRRAGPVNYYLEISYLGNYFLAPTPLMRVTYHFFMKCDSIFSYSILLYPILSYSIKLHSNKIAKSIAMSHRFKECSFHEIWLC